jgi:DNA mismatch repair ATPase MutS
MNALDQRNNILITALLNGLFFWELHQIIKVETWKDEYGSSMEQWTECIGLMDALCSLGTFAYNNPSFTYPIISPTAMYKANGLKHPLMNREKCVSNDINMAGAPDFEIITGANMAGKSTYLRTVGINHLLGCMGMPVDAESMTFYPAHLVTSLRTNDSLNDNESYFFAELKRLKMIIDKLQSGEKLFIILDEILRGTNSADKQKGSYSFIKQLTLLGATGLIATHDLQLAHLKELFPEQINTQCFEADITNNELTFSYKLREGVAQNMNACFLMKKMGIKIEENEIKA